MKPEPRSMTLVDVMMMAVGVAVGLAIVERQESFTTTGYLASVPDRFEMLAQGAIGWLWVGSVSLSMVAIGRGMRQGRRPRPAEWLVIVVSICYAVGSERIWLAEWASYRVWGDMDRLDDFGFARRMTCGVTGMIAVAGLVTLRVGRRALPNWVTTIGLCGSIALLSWGPVYLIGRDGGSWVAPSRGLSYPGVRDFFRWAITSWIALIPAGLMMGLPAIGVVADRMRRRPWTWVEFGSVATSGPIFALLLAGWKPEFDPDTWVYLAEWGMMIVWVMGVAMLSALIHAKLGPIGRHWYR